jgi:SanA protein
MVFRRQSRQRTRVASKWVLITIVLISLTVLGINLYVISGTETRIVDKVSDIPQTEFGLLMGTDLMRFDGSTNIHFLNRIEGASKAYLTGKVAHLVISGNKNNKGFNEVTGMQRELLKRGIPVSGLILDFEGKSTWETIRRAKEIYHLQKITIITDAFHAPRAIFLCRHFGIDAVAFCYGKQSFGFWSIRYDVREWLARVKAFFEVLTDKQRS